MNVVDVVILVVAACFIGLGWLNGLARALCGFTGLMVGTAVGIAVTPLVLGSWELSVWLSLAALLVVAVGALLGRILGVRIEERGRARVPRQVSPRVSRPAGAVFGGVAVLMVSWMLGLALAGSTLPLLAPAAHSSAILRVLDRMPLPLSHVLVRWFADIGGQVDFARYVDPLRREQIVAVPAPPAGIARDPDVVEARRIVARIRAHSDVAVQQGTGFWLSPTRVATAAHVVARADPISVQVGAVRRPARIAYCDPRNDLAVLAVPGARGVPASLARGRPEQPVSVLGYPGGGPYRVTAARIRSREMLQNSDIFGEGRYERTTWSLRARVHPGNSGGPVVDARGRVVGLVILSSRADPDTGYALTAAEVERTRRAVARGGSEAAAADRCR